MEVTFIEEQRIREQLKNLMEDDEKRKRGALHVLRKDKMLARQVLDLRQNAFPRIMPNVRPLVKAPPAPPPVAVNRFPSRKPAKAPSTITNNLNKALNSQNSKMRAANPVNKSNIVIKPNPVQITKVSSTKGVSPVPKKFAVKKPLVVVPNKVSPFKSVPVISSKTTNLNKNNLESKSTKTSARATPRSNISINQTNTKTPSSAAQQRKKPLKASNSTAKPVVIPLISNHNKPTLARTSSNRTTIASSSSRSVTPKTKPQSAASSTRVQKLAKSKVSSTLPKKIPMAKGPVNRKEAKTTTVNTKLPISAPVVKPPLRRAASSMNKDENQEPLAKMPKKNLRSKSSLNEKSKVDLISNEEGALLSELVKGLSAKSLVTKSQKKAENETNSRSVEVGKVKALVAKIKALNPQINAVPVSPSSVIETDRKPQVVTKKLIAAKKTAAEESLPAISSSNSSDSSPSEEPELKKPKSHFDLDESELQEIISEADNRPKTSQNHLLYSVKGYFESNDEEAAGLSSADDDDSESVGLYTDSDVDSDFTLCNDELVSSNDEADDDDDDDSFAKHCTDEEVVYDFDDSTNDTDYKLPPNQVEDLIIHKGTASVRDIKKGEDKFFDSDDEESRIVEIPQKKRPKTIKQPKAYRKEELMKLTVYTSAASSAKIRKRHLALKAEDNDLPSVKSIPKLHPCSISDRETEKEDQKAKKRKESREHVSQTKEEVAQNEEQDLELNEKQEIEGRDKVSKRRSRTLLKTDTDDECPLLVPIDSDDDDDGEVEKDERNNSESHLKFSAQKSQNKVKSSSQALISKDQSELAAKADSCPMFICSEEDSDIKMIPSAAPKFNIFKSEMAFVKDRCEDLPEGKENGDNQVLNLPKRAESETAKDSSSFSSAESDLESMFSIDVNTKYMYSYDDLNSSADEEQQQLPEFKVSIVDAVQCSFAAPVEEVLVENATDFNDKPAKLFDDLPIKIFEGFTSSVPAEIYTVTLIPPDNDGFVNKRESSTDPDEDSETDQESPLENIAYEVSDSSETYVPASCVLEPSEEEQKDDDHQAKATEPKENHQPATQRNAKKSTNPFEDEESPDLISFVDETAISHNNNPSGSFQNSAKDQGVKDKEVCVQDLVNNNLHQCIMYAMNGPSGSITPSDNVSQPDIQFATLEESEEPIVPRHSSVRRSSNLDPSQLHVSDVPPSQITASEIRTTTNAGHDASSDSEEVAQKKVPGRDSVHERKIPKTASEPSATHEGVQLLDRLDMANTKKPAKVAQDDYMNIHINSLVSNRVLILLKNPIFIYGTVRLTVLVGTVDIFGYRAGPGESFEIFSAKGCNMIRIINQYIDENVEYDEVFVREALDKVKDDFTTLDLRNIRRLFISKTDAIVLLQKNTPRKKMISNFRNFMSENVFPNVKSFNSKPPFGGSEHILQCRILTHSENPVHVPFVWRKYHLDNTIRAIVTGGKGVGKSTFLRYLINSNIGKAGKILLIDLDIGQPELFVPQTISYTVLRTPLLGPGFFLNKQPHKAYVIGHTNVVMCPEAYKIAVKHLIRECQTSTFLQDIPWLINTMGYNKGCGAEIMAMIVEILKPTDLIQIQSSNAKNNFDFDLTPENLSQQLSNFVADPIDGETRTIEPYHFHKIESAVKSNSRYQKEWAMSSKDMRYAMILARLSEALYGEAQMITDCKPLWINFHKIHMYNMVSQQQNKSELLRASEGNLVYLCYFIDEYNPIECFGIGVVRAIDYNAERLYLVPAMPFDYMGFVNCLVIGDLCLPTSFYKNQGHLVKDFVPFVFETDDEHSTRAIKQVFHRPSEFLLGANRSFEA